MSVEVLVSGQESVRDTPAARLTAALRRHRGGLVVAALLVALALGVDQWQRQQTLDQLVTIAADGERTIYGNDRKMAVIVTFYTRELFSDSASPGLDARFAQVVGEEAARGEAGGSAIAQQLDGVRVLPWHHGVQDARKAYQDRLALWRTHLATVTGDPSELYTSRDVLKASSADARAHLIAALPWSASATSQARINAAFR